jgi:hypothetical protein
MTVTLRNARAETIFVTTEETCGITPPFSLATGDGKPVPLGLDACGSGCEGLQQHEPWACPGACMAPLVVRIEPDGRYDYEWSRSVLSAAAMPKECYFAPEHSGDTCQQIVEIAGGGYVFSAKAGTQCADCDCVPSASGSCEASYGVVSGEPLGASVNATLPGIETVAIVLQ